MRKDGYPRGKPEEDREKMLLWWIEEMRKCGLQGEVTVIHSLCNALDPSRGAATSFPENFLRFITGSSVVANVHAYSALIPGAPWPFETVVLTAEDGVIMQVLYHASLARSFPGKVRFTRKLGWFGTKLTVEGPGSPSFKTRKEILKQCKTALCFRYNFPLWGFHSGPKYYEQPEAFLEIGPAQNGSDVIVCITVKDEAAFVGRDYSLGLGRVLDLLKTIDQSI